CYAYPLYLLDALPISSRFIVSDLAAAANMARGALGAIDPTCEINLQLMEELDTGDQGEVATSRRNRYQQIRDEALKRAQEIIERSEEHTSELQSRENL